MASQGEQLLLLEGKNSKSFKIDDALFSSGDGNAEIVDGKGAMIAAAGGGGQLSDDLQTVDEECDGESPQHRASSQDTSEAMGRAGSNANYCSDSDGFLSTDDDGDNNNINSQHCTTSMYPLTVSQSADSWDESEQSETHFSSSDEFSE